MSELWDLVTLDKQRTGYVINREDAEKINTGLYHLTVRVWVKNKEGNILLTQRHENREDGLLWENTGGSVIIHEASTEGAVRELYEETGILVDKNELIYLGDRVGTNYIAESYMVKLKSSCAIILQQDEVVDAVFLDINDVYKYKDIMTVSAWDDFMLYKPLLENL